LGLYHIEVNVTTDVSTLDTRCPRMSIPEIDALRLSHRFADLPGSETILLTDVDGLVIDS